MDKFVYLDAPTADFIEFISFHPNLTSTMFSHRTFDIIFIRKLFFLGSIEIDFLNIFTNPFLALFNNFKFPLEVKTSASMYSLALKDCFGISQSSPY